MRQRFQPRQAEKAARALDGVNKAKDVIQNFGVVGILLETHQLVIDSVETLVGLRQELAQQIIHEGKASTRGRATASRPFTSPASFAAKRLSLVEQWQKNAVRKEIMAGVVRRR
jgi:hypothetical protein